MFSCFNSIFKKKNHYLTVSNEHTKFNLDGIEGKFYVESIYDGDTIVILVPTKLSIYDMIDKNTINLNSDTNILNKISLNKIRVRLYGIDTPELKPLKNTYERDKHIQQAKEARDFLSNLILNKIINVQFFSNDKYGRPLVKLYTDDEKICLNDLMIIKGYANKYDGGKKNENFNLIEIKF